MNLTATGRIAAIFESETFGSFEKRQFWVAQEGVEYPQTWALECQQGDCNILDRFKVGDMVTCYVSIRGFRFKKKDGSGEGCMNTLKVWKIVRAGQESAQTAAAPSTETRRTPPPGDFDDRPDDLPF